MEKVTGIKSVDFKVVARGYGVVNWNGSTELTIEVDGKNKTVTNHSMPKLRGYSNINGYWDDGNPKFKSPQSVDLTKTPLYISTNCLRHHLFRDESVDLQSPELIANMDKLLCSITGLVRGYVIPSTEHKRTSPLLLTEFEDVKHNGNFEQMGSSGSKEKKKTKSGEDKSTSIFSKTTFGDTEYIGYGSISIEQLEFISLDEKFSRKALQIDNDTDGEKLAEQLTVFIKSLGGAAGSKATYHKNYVRRGAIFKSGETGILLNDDAIDIIIKTTLHLIENLNIKQAKGYMYVDEVIVDYNNGSTGRDMMRIKHTPASVQSVKDAPYAVYFEGI